MKYYAIRVGKKPGIYTDWNTCKELVVGYPGAQYKSFPTLKEAEEFIKGATTNSSIKQDEIDKTLGDKPYAFVDGSFNPSEGIYGYGGYLVNNGEKHVIQGSGTDEELLSMRNIAGEILGAMAAVKKALEIGLSELVIYYDYAGIEMWATNRWSCKKKGTKAYQEYMNKASDKIKLTFMKVKGHTDIDGNEEADKLAKQAVGVI